MRTCMHACMHACIHACIRTCMHPCIHTHIQTVARTHAHMNAARCCTTVEFLDVKVRQVKQTMGFPPNFVHSMDVARQLFLQLYISEPLDVISLDVCFVGNQTVQVCRVVHHLE